MALDDSKVDIKFFKNNDSGYTSMPSPSQTPYSLYECSGFASVSFFNYMKKLIVFIIMNISFLDGQSRSTKSTICKWYFLW